MKRQLISDNFGACVPFGKSWIVEIQGALLYFCFSCSTCIETQRADRDSDMATQTKNFFFWQKNWGILVVVPKLASNRFLLVS